MPLTRRDQHACPFASVTPRRPPLVQVLPSECRGAGSSAGGTPRASIGRRIPAPVEFVVWSPWRHLLVSIQSRLPAAGSVSPRPARLWVATLSQVVGGDCDAGSATNRTATAHFRR